MHLDSLSPRFGIRILMDTDRSNRSQVTIPHVKFAISHVTAFVGIAKDDGSPGSLFCQRAMHSLAASPIASLRTRLAPAAKGPWPAKKAKWVCLTRRAWQGLPRFCRPGVRSAG